MNLLTNLFRRETFCPRLWDEVFIDDKGDVYSCCHSLPEVLGSIYREKLQDIYNNNLIQELRQQSLDGYLGCYKACKLLDKKQIVRENKPLEIDYYRDLRRIKIMFGEGCNVRCIMCPQNHRSKLMLDYEKLVENVDLAPFEQIELQGGEPLFIESAKRFFEYAAGQGKKVSFLTNGIMVTDEWAEKVARHSEFIYFSLNAATKETHERVNVGSKWDRVLRNVERVRDARLTAGSDLRILGHMTIIPENWREIALFIRRFKEFGFDAINFGYDRKFPAYLRTKVAADERETLAQEIRAAFAESGDAALVDANRLRILGFI